MLAALAGFVHDRQRAESHEHNRDEGNYYPGHSLAEFYLK